MNAKTTIIGAANPTANNSSKSSKKIDSNTWKKVMIGGACAIAFGGAAFAASAAMGGDDDTAADAAPAAANDDFEAASTGSTPAAEANVDVEAAAQDNYAASFDPGNVSMAQGVNDDMSFADAFAAARQEVGPGGVFEWHGGVYGTYNEDEWDQLSPDEQNGFTNNFGPSHEVVTPGEAIEVESDVVEIIEETPENEVEIEVTDTPSDETEVTVDANEVVVEANDEPTVQVGEIGYDAESGMTMGQLYVDNQEVVLIDVDGDQQFDVMVSDFNQDGEIQDDELIDISDQNITVDSLGGYTDGYDPNAIVNNDPLPDVDESLDGMIVDDMPM